MTSLWKQRGALAAIVIALAAVGCNSTGRVPEIRHATVAPPSLQPGQTARITVEIHDMHQIVQRVEGTLADYPDRAFKLHDDGESPDLEAGDGVWTMEVAVPFTASPGDYSIRFLAYDEFNRVIMVPGETGNGEELGATVNVTIVYPSESE